MNNKHYWSTSGPQPALRKKRRAPLLLAWSACCVAVTFSGASHAVEFGPDSMFSFYGFGEVTSTRVNNQCPAAGCQFDPDTDRQRIWTDDVVPGRALKSNDVVFSQLQLWLGAKRDLGNGFKVGGLLSQNWRDRKVDTRGFWREKNVYLSHEEYGTLTLGATVSRTWSFSDYPYASNLGLSYAWASTGAGYRNLTNAIRYTSRVFDVADGDLVLELTYDRGNTAFQIHKPRFIETWAHFNKGKLVVDVMLQDARNGTPAAFGAAVFNGPFYDAAADSKIGGSSQGVAVVQAIYQYDPKIELSGSLRRNRWSGAYAAIVNTGPPQQWNNMFNVDWGGTLNGVSNPGYSASSTDLSLGARYRMNKWIFATGLVYLGKASTSNPSERGQSNSALINTARAGYAVSRDLEVSLFAGMINYRNKGLSPLSMPSNATINGIDSRATKVGNWFGVGAKYSF